MGIPEEATTIWDIDDPFLVPDKMADKGRQ